MPGFEIMVRRVFALTVLCLLFSLLLSCDGGFPFISEMWEKSGSSSSKGTSHTIIVKAEAAAKSLGQPAPEFTYTMVRQ